MEYIAGPTLHRRSECEAVLRTLPRWFGIESSLLEYALATESHPTFAWVANEKIDGFVSLKQHFPESWEIHCIAVQLNARARGIGTKLLQHAEHWIAGQGAHLLQVKTLAANNPSPEYAGTRRFYSRNGFIPVEVFPDLWSPSNPALQMAKAVNAV